MKREQSAEQEQIENLPGSSRSVVSTDDRPIYEAWRAGGADEALAYTATQRVRDMAAVNAVTLMGAKIELQGADLLAKIELQGADLRARIEAQRAELGAKIEAQAARIEAQGAELGAKIEAQSARIEARGAELGAKIEAQGTRIEAQRMILAAHTTSLRWMMGILVAVFAALMVLLAQAVRETPTAANSAAAMRQAVEAPSNEFAPSAAGPDVTEQAP